MCCVRMHDKLQVERAITELHGEIDAHDEERAQGVNDVKAAISGKYKESVKEEMM